MANNQQELQRLLKIIPFGRANAIHAEDIARGLGYPTGGNQVETRELIRYAIQQGCVIVSTSNGYWRSNVKQEVIDCANSLKIEQMRFMIEAMSLKMHGIMQILTI